MHRQKMQPIRQGKFSVSPGRVKPVFKHIVCIGTVVATYTCAFLRIQQGLSDESPQDAAGKHY